MTKYCMTFQSVHPLHECWIEVWAKSGLSARLRVAEFQGDKYGGVYPEGDFHPDSYPGGCIAEVDVPNLAAFLAADPTRARVASLMEAE